MVKFRCFVEGFRGVGLSEICLSALDSSLDMGMLMMSGRLFLRERRRRRRRRRRRMKM